MKILGRVLTILVGAGPATYLCFIALMGIMFGFSAVFGGEIGGLVLVFWGLAGFYGTLSLWAVGFGYVRRWIVAGLIVGIIALTPIAGMFGFLDVLSKPSNYPEVLLYSGPIVVAIAWLATLTVRMIRRHGQVSGTVEQT